MRKLISMVGSTALLLAVLSVPASATSLSCETEDGGNAISIGVAALPAHIPGYNWDAIVAASGSPKKVTICHFGQNHSPDYWIGWGTIR
jgi:hypothetical protein